LDDVVAQLQKSLESEKASRQEERFIWIMVSVILVDVLWFRNAQNVTVPVVILILELVVLLVLAKRMGIQELVLIFERIINRIGQGPGA